MEVFPPQDRGKAKGFCGLGIVVAPILGPVLGGWLTDSYSCRWVFYINVPIGILAVFLTSVFVFDPPYIKRSEAKIDYWGIGFLALGIGSLQIMLDKGQEEDWFNSNFIRTLCVFSIIGLAAFLIRELTTEMMAHGGADPVTAQRMANGAIENMIRQQAAIMSFNDVFWLLSVMSVCMLPLIFLVRPLRRRGGAVMVH